MGVTVALSNNNAQILIHLVWTGEINGRLLLVQAISPDNGISWTYSNLLGTGFTGRFVSNIAMHPMFMAMPYLEYSYAITRIAITWDRTASWRLVQISENSGIPDLALCYKANTQDAMLFTLLNAEIGVSKYEGEFGIFRLGNGIWTRGENPFGAMSLAYDPIVKCQTQNNAYTVKALGIEGMDKIYVTQNIISE